MERRSIKLALMKFAIAQRASGMLGKEQSNEICLNAAQAKLGVRDFSRSLQQGDCKS